MSKSMWMTALLVVIEVLILRAYDIGFIVGAGRALIRRRLRRFALRGSPDQTIEMVAAQLLPLVTAFYQPNLPPEKIAASAGPVWPLRSGRGTSTVP